MTSSNRESWFHKTETYVNALFFRQGLETPEGFQDCEFCEEAEVDTSALSTLRITQRRSVDRLKRIGRTTSSIIQETIRI